MPWCIMTELETECVWAPKSGLRLDWLCHCALYRSMIMLAIIFGSPLNSSETMLLLTLAQIIGRIPQCLILESVSGMNIICCFFIVGGNQPVDLESVLFFFTGLEEIPPCGLAPCTLNFNHNGIYATASVCGMQLTLPIHQDYEEFREKMLYSFLNHGGYGLC